MLKQVKAGQLNVSFKSAGNPDGWPVLLLHGFPYDINSFNAVVPPLAAQGANIIIPYLRGFGPTSFLSADTPRSGQQAAVGHDVLTLMDALQIDSAILAGFDWGGTAACVAAALWPKRVRGVVVTNGYKIQDIPNAGQPAAPEAEFRFWYQYYFHSERGRLGLQKNRREFCRLLWRLWSPEWRFSEEVYADSAEAFDNPDFVDVVIHSYRHRYGLIDGDPALEALEKRLSRQPPIMVPAIILEGKTDGVTPPIEQWEDCQARYFQGRHDHWLLNGIGHNVPQEKPETFAKAVLAVAAMSQV